MPASNDHTCAPQCCSSSFLQHLQNLLPPCDRAVLKFVCLPAALFLAGCPPLSASSLFPFPSCHLSFPLTSFSPIFFLVPSFRLPLPSIPSAFFCFPSFSQAFASSLAYLFRPWNSLADSLSCFSFHIVLPGLACCTLELGLRFFDSVLCCLFGAGAFYCQAFVHTVESTWEELLQTLLPRSIQCAETIVRSLLSYTSPAENEPLNFRQICPPPSL